MIANTLLDVQCGEKVLFTKSVGILVYAGIMCMMSKKNTDSTDSEEGLRALNREILQLQTTLK